MQRITSASASPLFDAVATRRIESAAAAHLPPHTLMERAGAAVARLALALAPHARTMWLVCGPGNNGGDGLEAAMRLRQRGINAVVTWLGEANTAPPDAQHAWQRACAAGVVFTNQAPSSMDAADLCIDALLGIGLSPDDSRPVPQANSPLLRLLAQLRAQPAPILAIDLPSGLQTDTGQYAAGFAPNTLPNQALHTLSLLTLKPGLFTGSGRDAAGQIWFDDLGVEPNKHALPCATLPGKPRPHIRPHASHKGSYGDVAVIGGEGLAARGMGMTGAALLAARAALHHGAGRVMVALLDEAASTFDSGQPELMLRHPSALAIANSTVVCGCGGGQAINSVLAQVLAQAPRLVLDADALNAIASERRWQQALQARAAHGQITILTPHPLEAARLLNTQVTRVQSHRLRAAQQLADQFACVVVLKGSGTVIAQPDSMPSLNPTGNALLATAGTGDVLAGMVGAELAAGGSAHDAACRAVWQHGHLADIWPSHQALTASALASGAMLDSA